MATDASRPSATGAGSIHNPRTGEPSANVAVIAIHGVGRHPPGASAEALATLLASLGREDFARQAQASPAAAARYASFDSQAIEVPVAAVATAQLVSGALVAEDGRQVTSANDRHQRSLASKIWGVFDERRGFLAEQRMESAVRPASTGKNAAPPAPAPYDSGEFAYRYMLSQLADYHGKPDRNFPTVRFASRRQEGLPQTPRVHIYDAHYSDLSKPESTIVGFFFAFYQLLFHLAALGLKAVYWAETENSVRGWRGWPWRVFSSLHATAVRMLIMFVPLLNLVMLAIGICAFADKLNPYKAFGVGLGLSGILGLAATLLLRRNHRSLRRPIFWATVPLLGAIAGMGVFWLLAKAGHARISEIPTEKFLVVLTWLFVAGIPVFLIARKFSEMRPGAYLVGASLYVFNAGLYLFWLLPRSAEAKGNQCATAGLFLIQLVFGELAFCWVLCLTAEFLSVPVGKLCLLMTDDNARKCRARAAHRTGRFAFSISASLFLVVTLAMWSGIASYANKKLWVYDGVPRDVVIEHSLSTLPRPLPLLFPDVRGLEARVRYLHTDAAKTAFHRWDNYLDGLLLTSVTPGLPFMLLLIAFSFLLILWAFLPSVLREVDPPHTPPSNQAATRSAGEWLSRGLDNTAILIRLLWIGIVPVPLFFGVLHFRAFHGLSTGVFANLLEAASKWTLPMIQGTGAILAVSATAIVTLILKYGTVVLDTLLDVDNYLRTVPVDWTPRARIAERCTSLFRYIAAYRDSEGRPYDRLIIVAHSLGTLVAADLLRFLKKSSVEHPDPALRADGLHAAPDLCAVPVYLFTMGSPLRPLLNRFFPHLYEWVTPVPDNSSAASELGDALKQPPAKGIATDALPVPGELCVKGWCNAYRSGDYVGRYLWSESWLTRNATADGHGDVMRINDAPPSTRAEMCIGLGAHTHYWDRSAPDVAHALDALINNPEEIFPLVPGKS
jgi:hypothetical protein